MSAELTSEQIAFIDDMERVFYQTLHGISLFKRPGITLTTHQREMIRAIRNKKIRDAKRRARVVTRAKAAKGSKRV